MSLRENGKGVKACVDLAASNLIGWRTCTRCIRRTGRDTERRAERALGYVKMILRFLSGPAIRRLKWRPRLDGLGAS